MKNVTFPNRHSRITRFVITAWLVYCSHNAHADFTSIPAAGGTAGVYGSLSGPISRQSASSTQDFSNHYFLYTAAELNAAGIQPGANLQSLKFHKAAGGYTVAPGNVLKIYMKNSNTLPGTIWCNPSFNTQINGATLVAQYNNFSVSPLQGWVMDINFSQAFIYTGGSIEIGISWNCSAYAGNPSSDGFSWTEQPISNQCFGARNSTAIMSMTLQSKRPIINFGFFNVCTVPAPGFAYGPTTVCPAQNFSLQIQFPITAYGLIYRWQRATDSQFTQQLYTFPPSPQSALSCSQDSGIWYYRCKANCTNAIMNSTVYSSTLQVNTAPKPTLQVSGINPSCAAKNNGMLFCCGTGGTPPLVYSLNGTTPQANQLIGGLSSGTYTVQVNDAYACSAATEIILSSPDPLQISSVGTIAASNEQAYDGSVEFNMMGGTPPFQYSLDAGQNFQGNSSFTSLSAGNYQVTILDDNGCIHHGNVEVPYANFPWPTPEFELSVSPYHDTVAHLVWGFSGSLQYTLPEQWIVLRSTDSMHFTPVDSIQTFGLNDISSLPAGSYNEFGSILFSTEYNGVHRYIYNESLNTLQSNSRIYYRVLARFPLGGPSMYSSIIAFKPPFMQFAPFSPYDYTLSACPSIAPIPTGYLPTSHQATKTIGACTVTKTLFRMSSCSSPVIPCSNCISDCGCLQDSYCMHNCSQYLSCASTPWINSCGIPDSYLWLVTSVTPQATLVINPVTQNSVCYQNPNGQVTLNTNNNNTSKKYFMVNAPQRYQQNHVLTWPDQNGQIADVFDQLCSGCYTVVARDAGGQIASTTFCITEPAPLQISSQVMPACGGAANGAASIVVSGGLPPYFCNWYYDGIQNDSIQNLSAGYHQVYVSDSGYCMAASNILIPSVVHCPVQLQLRFFLQGYFTGNQQMAAVLSNQLQNSNTQLCDSVRVLLYEAQHPYTLLGSVQCVVQRNGYVNANLSLSAAGPYYVSIQHRNHIFSWSAVPLSPDPFTETLTYNFSSSANQVYGSNAFQIESGVWAFYAGDINQDENIDLSDYSLYESDALNFASGYIATDLNGDGSVDLLDSPVLDDNMNAFIFSIHP